MNFDLDAYFEELEKLYLITYYKKFHHNIQKARNRQKAVEQFISANLSTYFLCFIDTPFKEHIIETLYPHYEFGETFVPSIPKIKEYGQSLIDLYHRVEDPESKEKILKQGDYKLMKDGKNIVRYFAKYTAFQCFVQYLKTEYPEAYQKSWEENRLEATMESDGFRTSHRPFEHELPVDLKKLTPQPPSSLPLSLPAPLPNTPITWQNTNETEFVQFVYSLYYAGAIRNNDEGVVKLVETMAQLFRFKLSPHWQSKLSHSINRSKMDYEPPIIKTIRKGYAKLVEERTRE